MWIYYCHGQFKRVHRWINKDMTRATVNYVDLDAAFGINPRTRDVATKTGDNAIRGALRNLINTKHYERPFQPNLGCQIHNLLFDNLDALTTITAERTIRDSINKHEPRVELLDVSVTTMDQNDLNISITYKIRNTNQVSNFTTQFTRIR
jgi:phage baseplate assembly protein W